jgi:hypothetical protein
MVNQPFIHPIFTEVMVSEPATALSLNKLTWSYSSFNIKIFLPNTIQFFIA